MRTLTEIPLTGPEVGARLIRQAAEVDWKAWSTFCASATVARPMRQCGDRSENRFHFAREHSAGGEGS